MKLREWLRIRRGPHRPWRQRAVRTVAAAAVLAAVAYATLPWWLPTGWLAERVAAQLSRRLGATVEIGEVTVSWSEGLSVDSIRVADPTSPTAAAMIEIPRIQMAFDPLSLATGEPVEHLIVDSPRVRLVVDESGRWNIAQLNRPASDSRVGRISVRRAVVTVAAPGLAEPLRVEIADLQCRGGPWSPVEQVSMSAFIVQRNRRVPIAVTSGYALGPRGRRRHLLTGALTGLDLAALGVIDLPGSPLDRLEGVCMARIRLPMIDGKITDGRITLEVGALDVQRVGGERSGTIGDVRLVMGGDADIAAGAGRLVLRSIDLRGPGVQLGGEAKFDVSLLGGNWLAAESLDLTGTLDPEAIASLLTGGAAGSPDWPTIAGDVKLHLAYEHTDGRVKTALTIDAGEAEVAGGGRVVKPAGVPLTLEVEVACDDQMRRFEGAKASLVCGDGRADVVLAAMGVEQPYRDGPWIGSATGRYRVERIEGFCEFESESQSQSESESECEPEMASLATDISGSVGGDIRLRGAADVLTVTVTCDATQLRARAGGVLDKRAGQPVAATVRGRWEPSLRTFTVDWEADVPGAATSGTWIVRPDHWWASARMKIIDIESFAEQFPPASRLDPAIAGAADVRAELTGRDECLAVRVKMIGDALEIGPIAGVGGKARGVGLRADIDATFGTDVSGASRLEIARATIEYAESTADVTGWFVAGDQAEVDLTASFAVMSEDILRWLPESLDAWGVQTDGGLQGRCRVWGRGLALSSEGEIDAEPMALAWPADSPAAAKPAGTPARFQWSASLEGDPIGLTVGDWRFQLGTVGGMGDFRVGLVDNATEIEAASTFRLWVDDAAGLADLAPEVARWAPSGSVELDGRLRYDAAGLTLTRAECRMTDVGGEYLGKSVAAAGTVAVEDVRLTDRRFRRASLQVGRVSSDDFRLSADDGAVAVVMDVAGVPARPRGRVVVVGREVDATAIRQWLAPVGERTEVTAEYVEQLKETIAEWIEAIGPTLIESDLTVAADLDLVRNFPDDKVNQLYDAHNLSFRAEIDHGRVEVEYAAGVNGGTLIDRYRTDLTGPQPRLRYVSTIRDMMGVESLQAQVAAFFPDNEVHGAMWRELDVEAPLVDMTASLIDPRVKAPLEGWGKTTFIDGVTRGRAAPLWVTRVFPGLKLVEYPYERMVGFAEYRSDGSVYNDMIFSGATYNMFIEGVTDAEDLATYDVGVILGDTKSDPLRRHRYKQGRLLILQQKMKIVEGTKVDEEVAYPWPHESAYLFFVRDNHLCRLWLERERGDREE